MGCNVSPYRGGVLKYKETVTATIDSITFGETKTFFTASKNCIVKIKPPTESINGYFYINDTNAASLSGNTFSDLVDREELFFSQADRAGGSGYKVYYNSLLLLLKPGDKLQLRANNSFTNVQYQIYIYEWE
jgi:hypothetical protein